MGLGWGSEPKLEELLNDCILQLLMRRDGVDKAAIRALAAQVGEAARLARRKEAPCVL